MIPNGLSLIEAYQSVYTKPSYLLILSGSQVTPEYPCHTLYFTDFGKAHSFLPYTFYYFTIQIVNFIEIFDPFINKNINFGLIIDICFD